MKRVLRWLSRTGAVICLVLIIPSTTIAFWMFNADQVLFNPDTYHNALHTSFAESQILSALLNGSASHASRGALDLINNLPPPASDQLQNMMFPASDADKQVDNIITGLRNWLLGQGDLPNITIDLNQLKSNLTGDPAQKLAMILANGLPGCTFSQMQILNAFSAAKSFKEFPICSPGAQSASATATVVPNGSSSTAPAAPVKSPRERWITFFTDGLTAVANALPDHWTLTENILKPDSPFQNGRLTPDQLIIVRAVILLQQRLLSVLFLIPIALMCLIVILVIRTSKALFRWIGWALVISGLISLLPILLLPSLVSTPAQLNVVSGPGLDQMTFNAIARGASTSVVSALSLVILIQVAVLIVVGLVALVLSINIPPPLNWPPSDDLVIPKKPEMSQKANRI